MRIRLGSGTRKAADRSGAFGCALLIPMIFIAIGAGFLFFSISRLSSQVTTTGVIVDIDSSRDSEGDTSYRPVVEFRANDGATYRFVGRIGSSSLPRVGDNIEVLYDPVDPQGATEKTFTNLWLFPIAFGGFGLLILVFMAFGKARSRAGPSFGGTVGGQEAAEELDELLGRAEGRSDYPGAAPADDLPAARLPTESSAPTGGARAEFRRAEATMAPDGKMRYRIVAKDDAGNEYYSNLLDADPTVAIMRRGNEVDLVRRGDGWIVEFTIPEDD